MKASYPTLRSAIKSGGRRNRIFRPAVRSVGTQYYRLYRAGVGRDKKGKILVIDDAMQAAIPWLREFIVSLFHDPVVSEKRCPSSGLQLHDVSLRDTCPASRPVFWFVDKDEKQASALVPLTDFSPRKDEALERGILRGTVWRVPFNLVATPLVRQGA